MKKKIFFIVFITAGILSIFLSDIFLLKLPYDGGLKMIGTFLFVVLSSYQTSLGYSCEIRNRKSEYTLNDLPYRLWEKGASAECRAKVEEIHLLFDNYLRSVKKQAVASRWICVAIVICPAPDLRGLNNIQKIVIAAIYLIFLLTPYIYIGMHDFSDESSDIERDTKALIDAAQNETEFSKIISAADQWIRNYKTHLITDDTVGVAAIAMIYAIVMFCANTR